MNARRTTIAPALRRGEPVSLALRNPEIVDAIRRPGRTAWPQRVEFFERVPVERWYEAVRDARVGHDRRRPPVACMLVTFHDLTPLRRVEEMRADFVANASHELRTPLAALSGFIETLQGPARNDTAARERFLAIMQAQATRMARLIDDLLSLSRIELNAHLRPDTRGRTRRDRPAGGRRPADAGARPRVSRSRSRRPDKPLLVSATATNCCACSRTWWRTRSNMAPSGKRVDIDVALGERPAGDGRRALRCATTVRASRPNICRG